MKSNKPYLIRAFFEWIIDNRCTPLITVNVLFPQVVVPQEYVENDEVTFNISPEAVKDLKVTNQHLSFSASFSGIVHFIHAPIRAIQAIYAHENGEGLFFDLNAEQEDTTWEGEEPESEGKGGKSTAAAASYLKVVK